MGGFACYWGEILRVSGCCVRSMSVNLTFLVVYVTFCSLSPRCKYTHATAPGTNIYTLIRIIHQKIHSHVVDSPNQAGNLQANLVVTPLVLQRHR